MIDKGGVNTAAIESYNAEHKAHIEIRQIKYVNNIVEQDHRAIKWVARPALGVQILPLSRGDARRLELMHMIRKGQLRTTGKLRSAEQFYAPAA